MVTRDTYIELPLAPESATALCINVLAALGVKDVGRRGAEIRGLFPATVRSWGESVVVRVEGLSSARSGVRISTRSRFSPTLTDWGKSAQDIATVSGMLNLMAAQYSAAG